MLERWLYRFTADKPCRLIYRAPDKPYLERYFLFKKLGITCYLHRFVEPDRDEETHNHPFRRSLAICLSGWYLEERLEDADYVNDGGEPNYRVRIVKPGSFNFIRGGGLLKGDFHRIRDARRNTWTLFLHLDKSSSWGFLRLIDNVWRFVHYKPAIAETFNSSDAVVGDIDWWKKAKTGNEAGREPL